MGEGALTSRAAIAFLVGQSGWSRLVALGLLMLASSLTEGIGLLMLVPIVQLVAQDDGGVIQPDWLAPLAQVPLAWLLLSVVLLVSLRAVLVFAGNESRRMLDLELGSNLRRKLHQAVLGAEWRWLSRQNSADHAALILREADRVSGLVDQALAILTACSVGPIAMGASRWSWPGLRG